MTISYLKGIKRNSDELGRVVIPKKIRDLLKLTCFEALEVCIYNQSILFTPIKYQNETYQTKGILVKLDKVGRVLIPIEFREMLLIDHLTDLEVYTIHQSIAMTPRQNRCVICYDKTEYKVKEAHICINCIKWIKQKH